MTEELVGAKDSGYRGCKQKTISGRTCQQWSAQSPHAHSVTSANFPNRGIDVIDTNFCRNPDQSMPTIWCFTTDPLVVKEECRPVDYCKNTLKSNGITTKTVKFNDQIPVISIENDLLQNTQPSKCPISSCSIFEKGCSVPYANPDVLFTAQSPYNISLKSTNKIHGQTIELCIKCSNDIDFNPQSVVISSFIIKQTPCESSLVAAS